MIRLLLIISLIVYVFYKLGLFRIVSGSMRQGYDDQTRVNRRPPNSNVEVDTPVKKQSRTGSKEGEYIDYEEIKD